MREHLDIPVESPKAPFGPHSREEEPQSRKQNLDDKSKLKRQTAEVQGEKDGEDLESAIKRKQHSMGAHWAQDPWGVWLRTDLCKLEKEPLRPGQIITSSCQTNPRAHAGLEIAAEVERAGVTCGTWWNLEGISLDSFVS